MDKDNKIYKRIIIAPYKGEVKVSEDKCAVTIDGVEKLRGYAMSGGWRVECEDDWRRRDNWLWRGVVRSSIEKTAVEPVLVATEEIHAICFMLRRSGIKYAVLTPTTDGRYHFLNGYDAGVEGNTQELVFEGNLPYPVTFYDGEVEVVGNAVPELLNYLWEKKYEAGVPSDGITATFNSNPNGLIEKFRKEMKETRETIARGEYKEPPVCGIVPQNDSSTSKEMCK